MGYNTGQGLSMGMQGAATGMSMGGPWGAAAGGALGLASGFLGGDSGPSFDEGLWKDRQGQIESFRDRLAGLRTQYRTSLANLSNNTYNRFMPLAQAQFAGKGLQVSGGAYGAALARKAAELQDMENVDLFNREREDINRESSMWDKFYADKIAAKQGISDAQWKGGREDSASMGKGLIAGLSGLAAGWKDWKAQNASIASAGMGGTDGMSPRFAGGLDWSRAATNTNRQKRLIDEDWG